MNLPVFSVRDSLIGFGSPFTAANEAVAVRGFTNSIIAEYEGGADVGSSPEDLSLYRIGEFNTLNGVFSPCEPNPLLYGHAIVTEHINNSNSCFADNRGELNECD